MSFSIYAFLVLSIAYCSQNLVEESNSREVTAGLYLSQAPGIFALAIIKQN